MTGRERIIIDKVQLAIDALLDLRAYLLLDLPGHEPTVMVPEVPPTQKFDFEAIYARYPRKQGKLLGMKKCRSTIKKQSDYEDLKVALSRFLTHHQHRGTDPEMIPYFSTFMSSWGEWLLPETGTVTLGTPRGESTDQYRARIEQSEERNAQEWEHAHADPAKVRAILDRALGKKSL